MASVQFYFLVEKLGEKIPQTFIVRYYMVINENKNFINFHSRYLSKEKVPNSSKIHRWPNIRTSKGQLISECPFDVSNFPKNQRKI